MAAQTLTFVPCGACRSSLEWSPSTTRRARVSQPRSPDFPLRSQFLQSFQPRKSPRFVPHPFSASSAAKMSASTTSPTHVPRILISGAPASGKGTQCEGIVSEYGVVHISTGDMLRAAVAEGTELGKEAKSYMESGKLVPDHLVTSLLKQRIVQEDCVKHGWLLDGFPRTAAQATVLSEENIIPDAVVVLDVDDETLVKRVVGRRLDPVTGKIYHVEFNPPEEPGVEERLVQRSDDTEEKAKVRIDTYKKKRNCNRTALWGCSEPC